MSLLQVVPIENLTLAVTINSTDYIPISQNGVTKKVTFSTLSAAVSLPALATGKIYIGDNDNLPAAQTMSGDASISQSGSLTIGSNAVTNAKFRQSAALSVVANATNATANVSDLTAGTDGQILARNGTALEFRLLNNNNVSGTAAIAYSKLNLTGGILNADVNASAGIVYTKLNLTGGIVNTDVNASAAIAYSKLNLTGNILNADINASAGIVLTKLASTSFTKTVGSITSGDTINTAFSKAVSSNGDTFGAAISIGTNDDFSTRLLQKGAAVFIAQENAGAYDPKYIMIGDRAASSIDENICVNIGSTSQQTTTGVGKGLNVGNRITVSGNNPTLYDIYSNPEIYNPAAHTISSSTLVGLRLGYDTGTSIDWALCFTRATGWIASDGGDVNAPFGFSDASAPTVYIGGNGTDNINYILGDPKYFVRVKVQETGGTFVDVYVPGYAFSQIPNTP